MSVCIVDIRQEEDHQPLPVDAGLVRPADRDTAAPRYLSASFDVVYQREFKAIVAVVYATCGSRWVAEDLAQDAFTIAHRRWAEVGEYDRPGAFVRRVALNLAASWRRRRVAELRALARVAIGRKPVVEP